MDHQSNETLRKSLHIGFGLLAFSLRVLPWWLAVVVAAAAILGNWLVLPRVVGTSVSRHARGYDRGTILYPVAVLLLIIVFRDERHVAAIAWAILAFGDGVATLAGRALRLGSLPWNKAKSWGGLFAFIAAGCAGGLAVAAWMGWWHPAIVCLAVVVAAIVESLDLNVDDNLTVPLAASITLVVLGFLPASAFGVWPQTPLWLLINAALALVAYFARSVDASGALGGCVLGAVLIFGGGWPLYATLLMFFVLGTATTKLGYGRKERAGLAQEQGGRRGFTHAFANTGVAAICAVAVSRLARVEPREAGVEFVPLLMGVAALATAAADTVASEIGQLLGRRAFMPLSFRAVPPGTEGAISVEGTAAGIAAGALVASVGAWSTHVAFEVELTAALVVALSVSAFLGSYLESIAGSWNRRQPMPVTNGALNFANTMTGALLFYAAWRVWPGLVEWHRLQ